MTTAPSNTESRQTSSERILDYAQRCGCEVCARYLVRHEASKAHAAACDCLHCWLRRPGPEAA